MSDNFGTFPKSIMCHSDVYFDVARTDRFGNSFRNLEQRISFKDKVLEEPLESIHIIDPEDLEAPAPLEINTEPKKLEKNKKIIKRCSCSIQ